MGQSGGGRGEPGAGALLPLAVEARRFLAGTGGRLSRRWVAACRLAEEDLGGGGFLGRTGFLR